MERRNPFSVIFFLPTSRPNGTFYAKSILGLDSGRFYLIIKANIFVGNWFAEITKRSDGTT